MGKSCSIRQCVISGVLLILSLNVYSEQKYKVSDIPKDLLTDAKAVVRNSETVFEISDIDRAVKKVTYAVTILNLNGIDESLFFDFYNKFLTIRKVEWDLYDQSGNRIKKDPNTELKDYSAISGFSIYEDNRVKFVDPKYRATPFTVEYKYEVAYNGLLIYPEWNLYSDYNVSVEKSSFTIITPKGFQFRYLQKFLSDSCIKSNDNEKVIYKWSVINKTAIREEPFSVSLEEYTPVIFTAPNNFEIGGFKGNLETWKDFGKWINTIDEGRGVLSDETTARIKKLLAGKESETEKIALLYKYLQEKVRYASIQVGIGGWQTIEAETVDRLSYGDCKALSNYMKSLLDIAGIKSYYTLVRAGADAPDLMEEFPSNQFNHAIVCIPEKNDTLWLECTDQHIPAGYLGKFSDDRNVLLIGDEGGRVIKTRKYGMEDNIQVRTATINLSGEGNAESVVTTTYKGTLCDNIYRVLMMDDVDRKKDIQKRIPVQSFDIINFRYAEKRDMLPSIEEQLNLRLPNYGTITGNRILINPNLLARFGNVPNRTKDRKSVIHIKRPYNLIDTVIIKLPLSYKVEQVPSNIDIKTKFGQYSTSLFYDLKEIRFVRQFKFFKGDYPILDYEEFVNFCQKIATCDELKVALERIF